MESKQCAKLVLNTALFYPLNGGGIPAIGTMDTTMGYSDPARLNSTFTNLDWKQIIGLDMWEKYDKFNLVLVNATYMSSGGTPFGNAGTNYAILIKASGLDWVNQTYDVYSKCKTSEAVILTGSTNINTLQMPVYNSCTFRKPGGSGAGDFTIRLYRALDMLQTTTDRCAAYMYVFNIYGVEE